MRPVNVSGSNEQLDASWTEVSRTRRSRNSRGGATTLPASRNHHRDPRLDLDGPRGHTLQRIERADAKPLEGILSAESADVLYRVGARSPTRRGRGLAQSYGVKPAPQVLQPADNGRVMQAMAAVLDIMVGDGSVGIRTAAEQFRDRLRDIDGQDTAALRNVCVDFADLMDRYERETLVDDVPHISHAWKKHGGCVRSFINHYDITVKNAAERVTLWGLVEVTFTTCVTFSPTASFREVLKKDTNIGDGYCLIGWPRDGRVEYFEQRIFAVAGEKNGSGGNIDELFTKFLSDNNGFNHDGKLVPVVAHTPVTTRLPYSYVTYDDGGTCPTYIDAEFKILAAIDNKLVAIQEQFGLAREDFQGPLHLGSKYLACDPCSKAIKAFQEFWPNVLLHFMTTRKLMQPEAYLALPESMRSGYGVEDRHEIMLDETVVLELQRQYEAAVQAVPQSTQSLIDVDNRSEFPQLSQLPSCGAPHTNTLGGWNWVASGALPTKPEARTPFSPEVVRDEQPPHPNWFEEGGTPTFRQMLHSEVLPQVPGDDAPNLALDLSGVAESWEDLVSDGASITGLSQSGESEAAATPKRPPTPSIASPMVRPASPPPSLNPFNAGNAVHRSAIRTLIDDMLSYGETAKLKLAAVWIADPARSPRDVLPLLVTMGRVGGASALHFAARHDNPVAIGLLIQAGAVLRASTEYEAGEATPLGWACTAGAEGAARLLGLHELAQAMREDTQGPGAAAMAYVWPDYPADSDAVEQTAAKLGAATDHVKQNGHAWAYLVAHAAKDGVNAPLDEDGATALHLAAKSGWQEAARILLAAGADPWVKDNDGASPAQYAANHGHDETMLPLLFGSKG